MTRVARKTHIDRFVTCFHTYIYIHAFYYSYIWVIKLDCPGTPPPGILKYEFCCVGEALKYSSCSNMKFMQPQQMVLRVI